jgi:type III secretion protein R
VLLVMLTSFVKLSVVLSLVRNALGTPQVPPGLVVTGLALVLTLFVMAPVIEQVADAVAPPAEETEPPNPVQRAWPGTTTEWLGAAGRAEAPVIAFLAKHAHAKDRATFQSLASRLRGGAAVADDRLVVLAPAFITSELKEAFAIGLLLLLPFLVIDLVVGMSLASLGLQQTSPAVVALPVKLLLFVAVDGWRLLVEGLVLGYA